MQKSSIYQQIEPQSEQLKKWIKLYYIHESANVEGQERITYFPNYTTTINIYQHSKVTWDDYSRIHTYDAKAGFLQLLVSKFDRSREIIMRGRFKKISIVFNPLGINQFLRRPLSGLTESHFSFFDHFGPTFDQLLATIFTAESLEQKRNLLDAFFCAQYIGFEETRLTFAVEKIVENTEQVSIQEIAGALGISRKTILRLFKQHLAYSPSEYKSVVRFRRALEAYQNKHQLINFSELAYEALYYDQSDLNFHFKQKTGLTPQQLFLVLQTIEKGLYWKIDHVPKVQDKE
jgi:AraC-like DNA-binding protein